MLDKDIFSPIDYQAGSFIYKSVKGASDDLLLFYCYLAASFRQGSLFVTSSNDRLVPALDFEEPILQAAFNGYLTAKTIQSPYVVINHNTIALASAFKLSQDFVQKITLFQTRSPDLLIDLARLQQRVTDLQTQNRVLPEQAAAIVEAANTSVSCIWGGPGTGKTYTAGWLVKLFLEQHPDARIVLAAPTGKAAANLHESIKRSSPGAKLEAKTLHSLLGLKRIQKSAKKVSLAYDLVLVDESSMIDISLFNKLMAAVNDRARIVFLGDPFQLPPVEPGEPFVALIDEKNRNNMAGELVTTKRQENHAIIDLAAAVKTGKAAIALEILQSNPDVLAWHAADFAVEAHVKQLYSKSNMTVESFFASLLDTRLLCPQRAGPYGTLAINKRLTEAVRTLFEPIIITKNDYTLGLTNGQVGVISNDLAYFEDFEETKTLKAIPKILLSSYETAYCLSVHKSQGSEFGHVILLLPEGSERFGRKMLYTAITRAKKKLTVYSHLTTLQSCITHNGRPTTTHINAN
ncbi:MAG: AAA family ATPase [Chlamydiales bacterium]|nr:AAA family ATPase [Chlamydiales bacterium]